MKPAERDELIRRVSACSASAWISRLQESPVASGEEPTVWRHIVPGSFGAHIKDIVCEA